MGARPVLAVDDGAERPLPSDRRRLERMFVAHHVVVWRALRRMGLSPDAAADATQQTFLIAAERLDDIHPDSEQAFLVGTAFRAAHTLHRKTIRWQLDADMDERLATVRHAGEKVSDLQLCNLAIAQVNSELAEVFVLYEVAGLSTPEIAALLRIPLGSVASRLRRAREQFRAAVARIEIRLRREDKP